MTGEARAFRAPPDFPTGEAGPLSGSPASPAALLTARLGLRGALLARPETDAWRVVHGAGDGFPGWYVDRLGSYLLSHAERDLSPDQQALLAELAVALGTCGAYHKTLRRHVRGAGAAEASPHLALGEAVPGPFVIHENGLRFELSFAEGYSVGLFLDQRDNRRRLLTGYVAAGFELPPARAILNTFAYTCGFSVAAAKGGAATTSLDLSRKYLEWGRRNFALNGLAPERHDFIYGDTIDWLRRLARKGRQFDLVLLDPPTFSQSKASGVFQAKRDYGRLATAALPLIKPGGVLFASTNAADWPPADFLAVIEDAVSRGRRTIIQRHYAPQPPDFPIHRAEPAYLKTTWLRLG